MPAAEFDNPTGTTTAAEAAVESAAPQRVRIRFAKQGDLRLISHRDLVRTLERLFRRAAIEVRQSEGFHPKPRMMFPSALGLGIAGLNEVVEVDLAQVIGDQELLGRLAAQAPPGLDILAVEPVPAGLRKARAKCLWYELAVPSERVEQARAKIAELLSSAACPVARAGARRRSTCGQRSRS